MVSITAATKVAMEAVVAMADEEAPPSGASPGDSGAPPGLPGDGKIMIAGAPAGTGNMVGAFAGTGTIPEGGDTIGAPVGTRASKGEPTGGTAGAPKGGSGRPTINTQKSNIRIWLQIVSSKSVTNLTNFKQSEF